MKLLFDQNISFRIVNKLKEFFPDCKHVSDGGLKNREDPDIWLFAHDHDYVIVTFDSDFYDISLLNGSPPKIIWIRTGNLSTNEIIELLKENKDTIYDFLKRPEHAELACLEIG
jgi:predicted nuclease of predicted toxin-antitoxin system